MGILFIVSLKFQVDVSSELICMIVIKECCHPWVVSSMYIIVHSHFDLFSSLLALEATELVSEQVTQMALELIYNRVISVQQKG